MAGKESLPLDKSVEADIMAPYFETIRESFASSKTSAGILSLNRASFNDPPLDDKKEEHAEVFKRPKTPIKRANVEMKASANDDFNLLQAELEKAQQVVLKAKATNQGPLAEMQNILFSTASPHTPRPFLDELDSLTPESVSLSLRQSAKDNSFEEFPLRDPNDAINMLKRAEKKFIPNTSGFSHNSELSSFSERPADESQVPDLAAIEKYFAARSNSISSIVAGKSDYSISSNKENSPNQPTVETIDLSETIKEIHQLLKDDLSSTAICGRLIGRRETTGTYSIKGDIEEDLKDLTIEATRKAPIEQSTPLVAYRTNRVVMRHEEDTPVRRLDSREPRRPPVLKVDTSPSVNSSGIIQGERRIALKDVLTNRNGNKTMDAALNGFILSPSVMRIDPLPTDCFIERPFILIYDGFADLNIYIHVTTRKPMDVRSFYISKRLIVNQVPSNIDDWDEWGVHIPLTGQKKHVIELNVRFDPFDVQGIEEKGFEEFEGELLVDVDSVTVASSLLQCTAAYGKFLCRENCRPFELVAPSLGASTTRQFQLLNAGVVPLTLNLQVVKETNLNSLPIVDPYFNVPESVTIPVNESADFSVTFRPGYESRTIQRYLRMNLHPNGRTFFDVELIGRVATNTNQPLSSRASVKSGTSTCSRGTIELPLKLTSSKNALSWLATPLQKSIIQSFQVKLEAECSVPLRIVLDDNKDVFKLINERGEALHKIRKTLKPGVPLTVNVRFKPDSIGLHTGCVKFQLNALSEPSKVQLTGYGGYPKMQIENTSLDLQGNRMIKLTHPVANNSVYNTSFRVTNYGNVSGFILITPDHNLLAVSDSFRIFPQEFVLEPSCNVTINLSQKLSRAEFQSVLAGQEIRKIATLNIVMGDEPSRVRFRKHLAKTNKKKTLWGINQKLIMEFPNEKEFPLENEESKDFDVQFLNGLIRNDVAVALEKFNTHNEQTVLELDETLHSFATLSETVLVRPIDIQVGSETSMIEQKRAKSLNSVNSEDMTSKKVQEWLRKVDESARS